MSDSPIHHDATNLPPFNLTLSTQILRRIPLNDLKLIILFLPKNSWLRKFALNEVPGLLTHVEVLSTIPDAEVDEPEEEIEIDNGVWLVCKLSWSVVRRSTFHPALPRPMEEQWARGYKSITIESPLSRGPYAEEDGLFEVFRNVSRRDAGHIDVRDFVHVGKIGESAEMDRWGGGEFVEAEVWVDWEQVHGRFAGQDRDEDEGRRNERDSLEFDFGFSFPVPPGGGGYRR